MITSKMAFALLDSIDVNSAITDPDSDQMMEWLAMLFPLIGLDGFNRYKDIPLIATFLANPMSTGLEAMLEDLTDYYCNKVGHKTKPGVQVASLGDAVFYASVTVFPLGPDNKSVVAKAREPNVYLAIYNALSNWKGVLKQILAEEAAARSASGK